MFFEDFDPDEPEGEFRHKAVEEVALDIRQGKPTASACWRIPDGLNGSDALRIFIGRDL